MRCVQFGSLAMRCLVVHRCPVAHFLAVHGRFSMHWRLGRRLSVLGHSVLHNYGAGLSFHALSRRSSWSCERSETGREEKGCCNASGNHTHGLGSSLTVGWETPLREVIHAISLE